MVTFLLTRLDRTWCSRRVSMSSVDLLFLKPHWVWLSLLVVSKNHESLVLMSFSMTLLTQDSSEIGRYAEGSDRSLPALVL